MHKLVVVLGAVLLAVLLFGHPQPTNFERQIPEEACSNLMKFGIYDKFSTLNSEYQYKQAQSLFKNFTFTTRQEAHDKASSIGLDIDGILNLTLAGKDSGSSFEQWRQELLETSYMQAITAGLKVEVVEKISSTMTDLVKSCLNRKGIHAYIIPSADNQNFTFTIDYVPSSSTKPSTKGKFVVTPSSVAATAAPKNLLDTDLDIGPQGHSVSMKRAANETVTITYSTDEGSGAVRYEAFQPPKPVVSFRIVGGGQDGSIEEGQSLTLQWDAKYADRVELEGFGEVGDSGTKVVSPGQNTDYRLLVTSLDGKKSSYYVAVKVKPIVVLTSASVHFHTTNDNKDHDTNVTVNLKNGGNTFASVSGTFGEFKDNTDSGWIPLNVVEKLRKDRLVGASQFQLIEAPNGNDEWHFNYSLRLTFSDGSVKQYDWTGGNVDSDRASFTQPI